MSDESLLEYNLYKIIQEQFERKITPLVEDVIKNEFQRIFDECFQDSSYKGKNIKETISERLISVREGLHDISRVIDRAVKWDMKELIDERLSIYITLLGKENEKQQESLRDEILWLKEQNKGLANNINKLYKMIKDLDDE